MGIKIVSIRTIFLGILLIQLNDWTTGARRENHFGNPCQLCDCFVYYTDRDVTTASTPYKVVHNPYESTEDRCLATCLNDQKCKLAVYGFIGGRNIFTCELYDEVNVNNPIYTPYTNIYLRRQTNCEKSAHKYSPLWTDDSDVSLVTNRKNKYIRLAGQQNPFNFG